MRKYYSVSVSAWLLLTVLSLAVAVWKTYTSGIHNAWWYFVAFGFALLLFVRRYLAWKNTSK